LRLRDGDAGKEHQRQARRRTQDAARVCVFDETLANWHTMLHSDLHKSRQREKNLKGRSEEWLPATPSAFRMFAAAALAVLFLVL
jgi:hypothetical protein